MRRRRGVRREVSQDTGQELSTKGGAQSAPSTGAPIRGLRKERTVHSGPTVPLPWRAGGEDPMRPETAPALRTRKGFGSAQLDRRRRARMSSRCVRPLVAAPQAALPVAENRAVRQLVPPSSIRTIPTRANANPWCKITGQRINCKYQFCLNQCLFRKHARRRWLSASPDRPGAHPAARPSAPAKARMSSSSRSGASMAAKWPPRGMSVQRATL